MRIRLGRDEIVEAIRDWTRGVVAAEIQVGEVVLSEGSRTAEVELALDGTSGDGLPPSWAIETKEE